MENKKTTPVEKGDEEIALGLSMRLFPQGYDRTHAYNIILEELTTKTRRIEELEKEVIHERGLKEAFENHLWEFADDRNSRLKTLEAENQKYRTALGMAREALRIARAWIPNYTAPEENDGFLSDMRRINQALAQIEEVIGGGK